MTNEARQVVETIKQAFSVFADMELPMEERVCMLSHDAAMTLIDELERVKRERDAAVEDLRNGAYCGDCVNYTTAIEVEPCKACLANRGFTKPNWQWRGVKEDT